MKKDHSSCCPGPRRQRPDLPGADTARPGTPRPRQRLHIGPLPPPPPAPGPRAPTPGPPATPARRSPGARTPSCGGTRAGNLRDSETQRPQYPQRRHPGSSLPHPHEGAQRPQPAPASRCEGSAQPPRARLLPPGGGPTYTARTLLRRRLPGWHVRAGREGGAGSGPDPSPGVSRADPPPCLSGAASLRGGSRLAVAPGGVAKPRRGCENGRRGVSEGREPRTSEGSHVSVQAMLSAGSAEGPHHAHASERTLECAVTLRVAATGGG